MNPLPIEKAPKISLPERRAGEDLGSYLERLAWHRNRLPKDLLEAPVQAIATSAGFRPWHEATVLDTPNGQRWNPKYQRVFDAEEIFGKPEPHKRLTPEARLDKLVGLLLADAEAAYKRSGRVELSASVMRRIEELTGLTAAQVEAMTVQAVREVLAQYAARLLVEAQNKHAKGSHDRTFEVRSTRPTGTVGNYQEAPTAAA